MRECICALIRTMILLVCSVIQVFEIIFRGIGEMFERFSELLKNLSDRLLHSLDEGKGKYEADKETYIETK